MWLPKFIRREPSLSDVKTLMNQMPPDQIEYLAMLTKSPAFGAGFLDAVRSSTKQSQTGFSTLSTKNQLKTVQSAAVVHACVTTIASAFQEAPLTIEERESDGTWKKTKAVEQPFISAFKSNPDLSESEIMQYSVMNLELTGKSFLWLVRDKRGEVAEVWPLPSSWVKLILKGNIAQKVNGSRLIEGYRIQFDNTSESNQTEGNTDMETFVLDPEDIIYTKFPSPWNLVDGLSPLGACFPYVELEHKGTNYQTSSLENLNLPGMAIKTDRQASDTQKKMLRAKLAEKAGPSAAAAAMFFTGKDLTMEMVNPLAAFKWSEFHKLNETRICMSFKVPPIVIGALVGLEETTGWASGDMREAKKWLYRNTVHGIWKMYSEDIGRQFIPADHRERYRISFDATQVPELQEERGKLEERAQLLFNASMITMNEAREMMLLESVPGGDLFKTNLSNMFLPSTNLQLSAERQETEGPAEGTPDEDEALEITDDEAENEGT